MNVKAAVDRIVEAMSRRGFLDRLIKGATLAAASPATMAGALPAKAAKAKYWEFSPDCCGEWGELYWALLKPKPYTGPLSGLAPFVNGITVSPVLKERSKYDHLRTYSGFPERNVIVTDDVLRKLQAYAAKTTDVDEDGQPNTDECAEATSELIGFADNLLPIMKPELIAHWAKPKPVKKPQDPNVPSGYESWEEWNNCPETKRFRREMSELDKRMRKSNRYDVDRFHKPAPRMDYAGGSEDVEGEDYTTLESVTTKILGVGAL